MTWIDFTIRLGVAFFLGSAIGLERQWRQRMAGLRTNTLVSTGAALFVMLGVLTPGGNTTQIPAYVVSGVGFLGGGVILRQGASVQGLNTAATLWCAAAIGALAGSKFLPEPDGIHSHAERGNEKGLERVFSKRFGFKLTPMSTGAPLHHFWRW